MVRYFAFPTQAIAQEVITRLPSEAHSPDAGIVLAHLRGEAVELRVPMKYVDAVNKANDAMVSRHNRFAFFRKMMKRFI